MITVRIKFLQRESNKPFESDGTIVKLYDKDAFEDDFLGQAVIDDNGVAEIHFDRKDFKSMDSPFEQYPDLYFTVYRYGKLIYKSKVLDDLETEKFSKLEAARGSVIELGTFLI